VSRRPRLTPRKQPRQARARRTVEAIVEAAAQVFEREGYARATTDRIAERAGVSIGTLYQYFPNKDALLVALAQQHVDAGVTRVRELLAAGGGSAGLARVGLADILRAFITELVELHRNQPRLHRLLFAEAPVATDQHQRMSAVEDELAAAIAELLEQHPEVEVADPMLAAWMLVHVTQGLVHDFIVHPPGVELGEQAFVDELVVMLQSYLVRARS
jgi:AcrR family transcriptional regulator